MKKIKRKVRLFDYDVTYEASIEDYDDLPWPKYVVHNNKVFVHENQSVGAFGYYRRDLGFRNTIAE